MKIKICLLTISIVCAGIVAHGADVTAAEMSDAYYWNALDEEGKICGGSWSEASNWLRNGAAVEAPPNGIFESVAFTTSVARAYTVKLTQDVVVSNLYVHCRPGNDRRPNTLLTLDMGGYVLTVTNMARVGWSWNPYPSLTVTNGTFVVGTSLRPGFDSNLSSEMARFFACGPETIVRPFRFYWGMRPESPYTGGMEVFRVSGGATFETTATNSGAYFASGTYRNYYYFSGVGTQAKFAGGIEINSASTVVVEDGARMVLDGFYENNNWGQTCRNCIGRAFNGTGNRLVVDNATLEIKHYPLVVGDVDSQTSGNNNQLIVTNGACVALADANAHIWLGRAGNPDAIASNNWLHVVDGGSVTGLASIAVGQREHATDNHLYVKDGALDVTRIELGNYYTGIPTNCWVHVAGTNSSIVCTASPGLRVCSGAGLDFTIGADGYAKTPIRLSGGGVEVTTTGDYYKVKPQMPKLRIDAEAFARVHPKTKVPLIECATACKSALLYLATNVTMVVENENYAGTVSVTDDGMKLIYESPALRGTQVLFK